MRAQSINTPAIQIRVPRIGLKSGLDRLVAAGALIVLAPLMTVLALLVRADGGTAFYAHPRVGRGGREFNCLKFRSMRVDGDSLLSELLDRCPDSRAEWELRRKVRNDPRVTRIGAFLRRSSLDELPQLINVLRGEMSLVGPRPVTRDELRYYGRRVAHYLECTPGITGLWQVSGRSQTSFNRRVALDSLYCRRQSLWLDGVILVRTIGAVLGARGAC
jgi:undecaprenyl-phosphate galactose phosphotransferase